MAEAEGMALHLRIDARWQAQFELAPAGGHEIKALAGGIELLMDPATARRAEGMRIDWVESVQGAGLSVQLPGAPPPVRAMSVEQLRERLAAADGLLLIDVRPAADHARAALPQARVLDGDALAELEALPKDRPLAFLCHYGNSSRQAAEHFRRLGFSEVYNVEGGIDAWSQRIDPAVPRY
jgi:monothiol glutaredoxin